MTIPDGALEISWNGKVYVDRFQLLGSVERDGEPKPYDVCIEDATRSHMNWYIKAPTFSLVAGKTVEQLQDLSLNSGPTSPEARAST